MGNTGIEGAHSNILEVLVVPNKTHNTDMSFTLPQVCVKFLVKFVIYFTLLVYLIFNLQGQLDVGA